MFTTETGFMDSTCTGSVCLYDVGDGSIRAVLSHNFVVWEAHPSPDGRLLATIDHALDPTTGERADPLIRLWDVEKGIEIVSPFRGPQDVSWVEFSPDGRYLLVTLYSEDTEEYQVEIWAVPTK
jgi:WD40 repeat protein